MEDFLLQDYAYELPPSLIAQEPAPRGFERLMLLPRQYGPVREGIFADIGSYLPAGALLVFNNTRVLPARLQGVRPGGGKVEFLLLTPLPLLEQGGYSRAKCLLRPSAKIRAGDRLRLCPGLEAVVWSKGAFGQHEVELFWEGDLEASFRKYGTLPLPPYIRRAARDSDSTSYQTVFARKTGAVAAPTAGLHFSSAILRQLAQSGFEFAEITLHVGYGTFSPVREHDIRKHKMHSEFVEIGPDAAQAIGCARKTGKPIVAIGTTSLRALEGVTSECGSIMPFSGWTDIFLYPGRKITSCDGLLTNFHLPGSTLLMLVAAFAGRKRILAAYEEAIKRNFRFFSYGDAMLIV